MIGSTSTELTSRNSKILPTNAKSKSRQSGVEAGTLFNIRNLLENGEWDTAKILLADFLVKFPNHLLALRYLAEAFLKKSESKNAERVLDYLSSRAKFYFDHKFLADSYYLLTLDNQAARHYEKALESIDVFSRIDQFEIYKNLGNIYVRLADYDGAEEFYNKAHCLFPLSDLLQVNLATLSMQRQDFREALERYREALNQNPKNANAFVGVALVHYQFGDVKLAMANLESALDADPSHETAMDLLIKWALRDEGSDNAIKRATQFLSRREPTVHISRSLAFHFHLVGASELGALEELRYQVMDKLEAQSD